jgi:hypothetical protein
MRFRTIAVALATTGMIVGPAIVHGVLGSAAGAKAECTISGTAADDDLNGTTRDDVISALLRLTALTSRFEPTISITNA